MTKADCKCSTIPFEKTNFFSKTILDYLKKSDNLSDFYNHYPSIKGFQKQFTEKKKCSSSSIENRQNLIDNLTHQYQNIETFEKTSLNIQLLAKTNTYTITTGHQLNLFTGPLYFLYKIISTINLCESLNDLFPEYNFVPIYWMATEDHDFDEINYFNFNNEKIEWNTKQKGAVGSFSTKELSEIATIFSSKLNNSKNANELRELFETAYTKHTNLADSTRYIANKLFGEYGLIVIDANTKKLKQRFVPYLEDELINQTSYQEISKTILDLKQHYKIQVNPREINLFYCTETSRNRILIHEEGYHVLNSDIYWTKKQIIEHLHEYPERFSPNVVMRPLYQEVILPNLCYIGGGGELAYWFELKNYFKKSNIPFPILLLRNSVQLIHSKQVEKLKKLNINNYEELFLKQPDLITQKTIEKGTEVVDFSKLSKQLKQQFQELRIVAQSTDKSFVNAVNAQEKKQLKGLENLQKKWLRAEKRKHQEYITRIINLQNELLPNQSLEERQRNFSEFYQEYGSSFIQLLKKHLNPLKSEFIILEIT